MRRPCCASTFNLSGRPRGRKPHPEACTGIRQVVRPAIGTGSRAVEKKCGPLARCSRSGASATADSLEPLVVDLDQPVEKVIGRQGAFVYDDRVRVLHEVNL